MKNNIYKPDYDGGSIVNLMSSIKQAMGGKYLYEPLRDFDSSFITNKDIVFIVIDGMGYDFLMKYGEGSFLHSQLAGKMTTVFPATTVAAMTSFATALAPQQHALTGWFMYLKEIGAVTTIIRFLTRAGGLSLQEGNISYKDIYNEKSILEDINVTSVVISYHDYYNSEYSRLISKGARRLSFSTLNGFFQQIEKALQIDNNRKFVYAYWAILDSICHRQGTDSPQARAHFNELDKKLALLAHHLHNRNAVLIVTADHGLIDTKEKNRIIHLKDHPEFADTLALPLTGEPRAAYCYVRPDRVDRFLNYVKKEFEECCILYKSDDLIKENYFGMFEPNPKLRDRVGDFTLIMKENYVIKDLVLGEEPYFFIGHHGGVSSAEMFVPLVLLE
jgi:predicted AlkP superfamily pyrophosphatase or phosphodiesterase